MQLNKLIIALLVALTFTSCATQYHRGDGVIIAENKIKEKDYQPHEATKTGAEIGGTIGAVGGAAAGGFVGLVLGAFTGTPPILIASTLGGAAIGSVVVGAAGGTVGGGLGYAVDATTPGAGLYRFVIKPNSEAKPLTITQYSAPIPLNTEVHILEKNDIIFIKQK